MVERRSAAGVRFALVRGTASPAGRHSLYSRPAAGALRRGLLANLGFESAGRGLRRDPPPDFDLDSFCEAFETVCRLLRDAERALSRCGLSFVDGAGLGRPAPLPIYDGHRASEVEPLRRAAGGPFDFSLTRLSGEPYRSSLYRESWGRGWTTHYRVRSRTAGVERLLSFLGLAYFDRCDQFDDGPCYWTFAQRQSGWAPGLDNGGAVRRCFTAHSSRFAGAAEAILEADGLLGSFGMSFLPSE